MKHALKITILLLLLFISSQYIGLFITKHYLKRNLPYSIERPKLKEQTSFIYIFSIIIIATVLLLILIKLNAIKLWFIWFFLSVVITLSISFSSFLNEKIAFILSLIIAFFKVFRRNIIIHNISELFIYAAISSIFAPVINIFAVSVLLILISIYDFISVNKTKHMVYLANFQTKLKLFTGFFIPYKKDNAVLGGGDIGFPLLFSSVLFKTYGNIAFISPLFIALSLLFLLLFSKKKKFYPAMPFLTIGCLLSYLVIIIITRIY